MAERSFEKQLSSAPMKRIRLFSLDFVRELRFATSVEGIWWKRSVFERHLAAICREMKGTNCDVKKQIEESKNDEH
jgi:hypothetical protein